MNCLREMRWPGSRGHGLTGLKMEIEIRDNFTIMLRSGDGRIILGVLKMIPVTGLKMRWALNQAL